ncbi:hypothetical protein Tco_0075360, partial [Tanacetum coccineum]
IIPPRMTTRSSGQSTAAPRGGRTGGWTGRGGGITGEPTGRVPEFSTVIAQQLQNMLPTIIAQGDVRNVNVNNSRSGCSYKEFLSCNPKDFDGKGGVIAYTRWTEKMESVQDMSGCGYHQKTRGREAVVGMTLEDFKALMREEFVQTMKCRNWNQSSGVTPWSELSMQRTLIDSMSLLG